MNCLDDFIHNVADKLQVTNGADDVGERERKVIVRGLCRIIDRFSIDSRKIAVVQQLEFPVTRCAARHAIGPTGDFKTWAAPQNIYYAAWKFNDKCGCNVCDTKSDVQFHGSLGERPIDLVFDVNEFHRCSLNRENSIARPDKMWWQQSVPNGEIVFNCIPLMGDTLMIRAAMPLEMAATSKKPCHDPDEWEFMVSPSACLCCDELERVMHEAKCNFNGDECWQYCTTASTCDPCPRELRVTVTARKKPEFYPGPLDNELILPPGYFAILVDLVAHEIHGTIGGSDAKIGKLVKDKNDSLMLLHRSNERASAQEIDFTLPWNNQRTNAGYSTAW